MIAGDAVQGFEAGKLTMEPLGVEETDPINVGLSRLGKFYF